ncbi:hypothetical protein AAE478_001761 [Parahypoxylon ruwenzoriense]
MASSPRCRRSLSLLSSSSSSPSQPGHPSSNRVVSSPAASQSQPLLIRQGTFRRMKPAKFSNETHAKQSPHQKRASSLAGFFSKILPSNRPEQGGTHRADWTGDDDEASNDHGANPNELTNWNLAKERAPGNPTSTNGPDDPSHRRVWSLSPQKGSSRFIENLPQDAPYSGCEQMPEKADHGEAQSRKSQALTRTEVHELLMAKEETRRNRRSLKESGDWLGVQGADPYSGQFSVLTPTDTLSSDTTPTSARSRLAGLSRKKKAAKLEYEQIKLMEEQEKEKARLDKERAKLNKIERVKEELRRQHQFAKWSQHKRQWSSAAEPNLSPIAQSLDSVALGSSENSSLLSSEMPTNYSSSDADDTTSTVPNFSRPTRPPVSAKLALSQAERLSSEVIRPEQYKHHPDQSTDTIIHNSPPDPEFGRISLTRPASQPAVAQFNVSQLDIGRTKSGKHFLWRRRRGTDPGKLVARPVVELGTSLTDQTLTSDLTTHLRRDHFADLAIPDYHLDLLSEPTDATESQSTFPDEPPSTTPNPNFQAATGENRIALSSVTNLGYPRENDRTGQDTGVAIATSAQSRLKGIMKRPSIRRKLVPGLLGVAQTSSTERHQTPPPNADKLQNRTVDKFPVNTPEYQSLHQQLGLHGTNSEYTCNTLLQASSNIGLTQNGSVSTPITIITGSAPDLRNRLDSPEPETEAKPSQIDGTVDTTKAEALAAPTPPDPEEGYIAPAPTSGEQTLSSPPITPRSGSPNPTPAQETAGIDITSTHPATLEKKPPTRVSTPTTPRLCRLIQENREKNMGATGEMENIKTETLQSLEAERASMQDMHGMNTHKIDQRSHSAGPVQGMEAISREARQLLSPQDRKESMVEEGAQIVVLRSREKEIATSKSDDRKASLHKGRTPSPVKRKVANNRRAESKQPPQPRHARKKPANEEGTGAGMPSRPEHVSKSTTQAQYKGAIDDVEKLDTFTTMARFCKTVCIVLLGLTCTWWMTVQPAFDQQSDLWKRKHRKQTTWKDVGVFASAGMFCITGAIGGWYAVRVLWWITEL